VSLSESVVINVLNKCKDNINISSSFTFIMIYVNIFLEIALYLTGIVYLIMLLLLTQLVFLKTDLINFGEIKHAILIIQPT